MTYQEVNYEALEELFETLLWEGGRLEADKEWLDSVSKKCAACNLQDTRPEDLVERLSDYLENNRGPPEVAVAFTAALATVASFSTTVLDVLLPLAASVTDDNSADPELVSWLCLLCHFLSTSEMNIAEVYSCRVVEKAVLALQRHPNDSRLLRGASKCLAHFSCYELHGALNALHDGLVAFADEDLIQAEVLAALSELAVHRNQEVGRSIQLEIGAWLGQGILQAIQKHDKCIAVQKNAAEALVRITDDCETTSKALYDRGCLPILMHSIEEGMKHPDVVSPDFISLASMSSCFTAEEVRKLFPLYKEALVSHTSVQVLHAVLGSLSSLLSNHKTCRSYVLSDLIDTIATIPQRSPTSPLLLQDFCNLLRSLASDSEHMTQELCNRGYVKTVAGFMQQLPADEGVHLSCFSALAALGGCDHSQDELVKHKVAKAICDAMKRLNTCKINDIGCLALGSLCWNAEVKADIVANEGIEIVLAAMKEHHVASVQRNGCRALAQIAYTSERFRDRIMKQQGVGRVCSAMREFSDNSRVFIQGCNALAYLAWGSEGCSFSIIKSGGLKLMIKALERFEDVSDLQENGCRVLGNLSFVAESWETLEVCINRVTAAMERFATQPEVQEEACRAAVALVQANPKVKHVLSRKGMVPRTVKMMSSYPTSHVAQQEGCNALAHLSYDSEALTAEITRHGGVSVCLQAMKNLSQNMKVQMSACGALSGLAFNNPEGQLQILQQNGVQYIINAMQTCDRLKMQEIGCLVLGTLSWNDDIKTEVAAKGGMKCIVAAMVKYSEHCGLQKNGCRAISQLAYNSEPNRDELFNIGGVAAVLTAMKVHSKNDKLLLHACVALTYLSWRSESIVQHIVDSEGVPAVQRVIDSFKDNEKLRKKAEHLKIILSRRGSPPGKDGLMFSNGHSDTFSVSPTEKEPHSNKGGKGKGKGRDWDYHGGKGQRDFRNRGDGRGDGYNGHFYGGKGEFREPREGKGDYTHGGKGESNGKGDFSHGGKGESNGKGDYTHGGKGDYAHGGKGDYTHGGKGESNGKGGYNRWGRKPARGPPGGKGWGGK